VSTDLERTYLTAEVAESLRMSEYHLRAIVRKTDTVNPMRINPDDPRSQMRWTLADINALKAILTPEPAIPTRRRKRRGT